jgi:hypothetical protein
MRNNDKGGNDEKFNISSEMNPYNMRILLPQRPEQMKLPTMSAMPRFENYKTNSMPQGCQSCGSSKKLRITSLLAINRKSFFICKGANKPRGFFEVAILRF